MAGPVRPATVAASRAPPPSPIEAEPAFHLAHGQWHWKSLFFIVNLLQLGTWIRFGRALPLNIAYLIASFQSPEF